MNPVRLYIENFMCHDRSYIDFTQFSAALIVGKVENNDLYSNGVGKTTIFKAIEYVLFNQADVNLERIIRDDTNSCSVTMDFIVDGQEYRVVRTRTKKGTTDLTLYQRTADAGDEAEVYHDSSNSPVSSKKFWKDISGRRTADTEKDLGKLIKINFKASRSTIHFLQNDFGGLPTATPEKRKGILKDALNLLIYTKLEKIAKDKSSALSKDIERHKTLIDNLGNPDDDLKDLNSKLSAASVEIASKQSLLNLHNESWSAMTEKLNELVNTHANLEGKFADLLSKEKTLMSEKARSEISVKEYQSKRSNIVKAAKELVEEIKSLKDTQKKLIEVDYSQIDILTEEIQLKKEKIAQLNLTIQNNVAKVEELKIPMPDDSVCKHCRQPLTPEHRKICQKQLNQELAECQATIQVSKKEIVALNAEITAIQPKINSLSLSKKQLEGINTSISSKNKEVEDKKVTHDEYSALLKKFQVELQLKTEELEKVQEELKNSSIDEANNVKLLIEAEKTNITNLTIQINALNKEITHHSSAKAVIQHGIDQKTQDKLKKEELKKNLAELEEKFKVYPSVLQAFSSTGIPNLIIQNVLDDLQAEANILLNQLKPGLQLSFFVEKTVEKTGDQADTLDINYHINGKERYYEQLSGAQKLAVTFSLKLGLSFLLQKMLGTDIKFLMLDEIDQSLDKASVDAFADIVKFFQKDYTILVITHNDRLKDKFSHAILVEQDINMVSRAKVVSSW